MRLKDLTQQYHSIKSDPVLENKTQERVLCYFKENIPEHIKINYHFNLVLKPALISALVLVFVFTSGLGTIVAAEKAMPGTPLYPLKKIVEKSQLLLAFNSSHKTALRAEILNNRFNEFKVLFDKLSQSDNHKSNKELDLLAQNFAQNLRSLKEEVKRQMPVQESEPEPIIPFPEDQLLVMEDYIEGDLPVQDEQEVFTVIPSLELEQLLAETKEFLAEKNMVSAFARLEEMEKLVRIKESLEEMPVEEEADKEERETIEQEIDKIKTDMETNDLGEGEKEEPVIEKPVLDNLSGSTGQISIPQLQPEPEPELNLKSDIKRETENNSPNIGGLIIEEIIEEEE
jgi:hypothetical protein